MAQSQRNRTRLPERDIRSLGAHWPQITPWAPTSTNWGSINSTYFVGPEQQYVLKLHGSGNLPQLQFEHAVLSELSNIPMSFGIPTPQRTAAGELLVRADSGQKQLHAAVYQVIPGTQVSRGDLAITREAGKAHGELHRALQGVSMTEDDAILPAWGDLDRVHPMMTNWRELTRDLGMTPEVIAQTNAIIDTVGGAAPRLRSMLPAHVVHSDYVEPNILVLDGRVSAVIDFEFVTYDLRAFDLAASLYFFCLSAWGDEPQWNLFASYLDGYVTYNMLTDSEIDALPMLLRWQRLGCLVYWTGLYRQSLASYQSVIDAANDNIRLETWLAQHGTELIDRCHAGQVKSAEQVPFAAV